jgi:hypothetical protein
VIISASVAWSGWKNVVGDGPHVRYPTERNLEFQSREPGIFGSAIGQHAQQLDNCGKENGAARRLANVLVTAAPLFS